MVNLGDEIPNFKARTTVGEIYFHEWIGDSWAILFSHPADYTPVCTTELARVTQLMGEFKKRGVKLIALSCDDVESHKGWIEDIRSYAGYGDGEFPYPIIADEGRDLAMVLGMVDPEMKDSKGLSLTCRALFIIGPDKKLKLSILYPASTGRNFDEVLRVVDSLQLTANKQVATPVDWKQGDDCMVLPTVKAEDCDKLFPKGVKVHPVASGKPYLRITPQP
uniref:1-Cys peroxiredoxin n=1 Tax=Hadrurus spadix TaxID=141984 RepID=A0A1W7R9Z4_9SCOR